MKTLVSFWKAYIQAFPFAFIGSLLCFYFVLPGFKTDMLRLATSSLLMAVFATIFIALGKQKVQFEIDITDPQKFAEEICAFIIAEGGKLTSKNSALVFFKKGSFEISVAIGAEKAIFSGTKLWLSFLYDRIRKRFKV